MAKFSGEENYDDDLKICLRCQIVLYVIDYGLRWIVSESLMKCLLLHWLQKFPGN